MKCKLYEKEYEVLDVISDPEILNGAQIPLINMRLMSDERWQESATEHAVNHYIQRHGMPPTDVNTALMEERRVIHELMTGIQNSNSLMKGVIKTDV